MSTKTSIKRIAAVAAVALTLGGFSAVSANAGQDQSGLSIVSADSTGTVGTTVNATVKFNYVAVGSDNIAIFGASFYQTAPTSSLSTVTGGNAATGLVWAAASDTSTAVNNSNAVTYQANASWSGYTWGLQSTATAAGYSSASYKLSFTPDKAGSYQVRIFGFPGATTSAIFADWNVTVAAKSAITAAASSVLIAPSTTTPNATTDAAAVAGTKSAGTLAGNIAVLARNSSTANNADAAAISATVTGSGLISFTNSYAAAGRAISQSTANNTQTIYVFSDGTAGTGTVTISSGTTVLASKVVTFYGSAATITPTVAQPVVVVGSNTAAVTAIVTDSNGNPVAGTAVKVVSDTAATVSNSYTSCTAASDATGKVSCDLTGVAAGTAKITLTTNTSSAVTSGVSAAPVSVRVGSATVASYTISTDKASYLPGELAIVSILMKDASGLAVADSAAAAGALSATFALTTNAFSSAGTPTAGTGNGTYSFKVNMPINSGDEKLTFTPTDTTLAASSVTVAVGGDAASSAAQAAVDAANEATDAANAATDAANNAMDSADAAQQAALDAGDKADAALAAVTDLATKVSAIATQIAALAALVKKIAAKVKA